MIIRNEKNKLFTLRLAGAALLGLTLYGFLNDRDNIGYTSVTFLSFFSLIKVTGLKLESETLCVTRYYLYGLFYKIYRGGPFLSDYKIETYDFVGTDQRLSDSVNVDGPNGAELGCLGMILAEIFPARFRGIIIQSSGGKPLSTITLSHDELSLVKEYLLIHRTDANIGYIFEKKRYINKC